MEFRENVLLAAYTTLGVGGPARWFAEAVDEADVQEALRFASDRQLRVFVLGAGSNVLAWDEGFDGLVLRIAIRGVKRAGDSLVAGAGESWDTLVQFAVDENLAGVECLSGIPGTVGGTPVQNVGAYGQEVSSTIERVRAIDVSSGERIVFGREECGFAYRTSRFNSEDAGQYIITEVSYKLRPGGAAQLLHAELKHALSGEEKPTLAQVREAVLELRRRKGMVLVEGDADSRSAGSFFKNPIVSEAVADALEQKLGAGMPRFPDASGIKLSAAWLIARAGFVRGFALGGAGISTRHTLALVNRGDATAAELRALRDLIAGEVTRQFGIELQQEPVELG
jgi:UDP-N-acetylmuramate dehydrogenase